MEGDCCIGDGAGAHKCDLMWQPLKGGGSGVVDPFVKGESQMGTETKPLTVKGE